MGRIVSAGFQSRSDADRGAAALMQAGFPQPKIAVFYLTPPRDDVDAPPIDLANASPGAEDARGTGPADAGIGAYVGSLYGALGGMKDDPQDGLQEDGQRQVSGPADPADADAARIREGMRVAVQVDDDAADQRARRVFEANDALEVSVGDGTIEQGMIVDAPAGNP